jgi:hypothetical protein
MSTGLVAAARRLSARQDWEDLNRRVVIMLDWDDVLAVATRALPHNPEAHDLVSLLTQFQANGASHLSLPELTVSRLLAKGELALTQGARINRIYLQVQSAALADLVVTELQERLPHVDAKRTKGRNPVVSFTGDLPSVAEIGLGFNPLHAELARQAGLRPVARPIGYSWVQPEMIERTLAQAAELGATLVAVQGPLVPGHEFHIQETAEAMARHGLTYAHFRESRHQKGDWFLAKRLAGQGQVILAHEFTPLEMLEDDLHTAAYRWATLAEEAGIRLCALRFFRILHAADPLESLTYVAELTQALRRKGLWPAEPAATEVAAALPERDELSLAAVGLSTAGAVGLATDRLPLAEGWKLASLGTTAALLAGLSFLERSQAGGQAHPHDHDHHHHHHHDHDHHHHHHHPDPPATAYAQKGLALAATVAYPAAALALKESDLWSTLAHSALVSATGAAAVNATTVEADYLLGVEEYRGFNLDWLLPLGLALSSGLLASRPVGRPWWQPWSTPRRQAVDWGRLALLGGGLLATAGLVSRWQPDLPAALDREHRQPHAHHASAFQQGLGDLRMSLSPRPLRKWALLAPLGAVVASFFRRKDRADLAAAGLSAAAVGQVATLTGFRSGQRPLGKTLAGRLKSWLVGAGLAGLIWLGFRLFGKKA